MKKFFLSGCIGLCLLAVACTKDDSTRETPVKFGVYTNTTPVTKTAYSDVVTGGVERIDWVAGDVIRIWSEDCPTPSSHYADYTVSSVKESGVKSIASVTSASCLYWGTKKTYTFWGLYPSPSTVSDGSIEMDKNVVTMTLPQAQPEDINMGLGYLAGCTKADYEDENSSLDLEMEPMTSTFVITLVNQTDNDITVNSVTFSSASQAVNGTYSVDLNTDIVTVPKYSEDNSSITVTPATAKVVKAVDAEGNTESMIVTMFAVPQDITDATLTVSTDKGTRSIKLQNKDLSNYTFNARWKYNMKFSLPDLAIIAGTEPINPATEETEWADVLVQGTTNNVTGNGSDIWD